MKTIKIDLLAVRDGYKNTFKACINKELFDCRSKLETREECAKYHR